MFQLPPRWPNIIQLWISINYKITFKNTTWQLMVFILKMHPTCLTSSNSCFFSPVNIQPEQKDVVPHITHLYLITCCGQYNSAICFPHMWEAMTGNFWSVHDKDVFIVPHTHTQRHKHATITDTDTCTLSLYVPTNQAKQTSSTDIKLSCHST